MAGKKRQISITMDLDLYKKLKEEVDSREISSISHGINKSLYLTYIAKKNE